MLKKILIGSAAALAAVVLILLVAIAMQPSEFRVERSAAMKAPPERVFEQVNDFHHWNDWSPWARLDPNAKNSFDGPTSGEGAIFSWAGNADVGEGKMTILESLPPERIRLKLEFFKPMAGICETLFTFKPEGEQTTVTWTMSGKNDFMGKAFSLFMDCDAMIGPDFEKGLANMKAIVETEPPANTTAAVVAETKAEN